MTSLTTKSSGLGELGDRTLRKVRRRVMPLIVLLYFIAYLDRNNVGFAKLTMSEDIGLTRRRLRPRRRHLLPRLRPPRSSQQRRHVQVRRPQVAGPHPHHLGHLRHGDGPGERRNHLLHHPVPARRRRGRLLPGHPLLPDPVVPRRAARHRAGHLHPGPAHLQRPRRPGLRPAPPDGRHHGPARLAVALHHRRHPRHPPRRADPHPHDGPPAGRQVAQRRRARMACHHHGRRTGSQVQGRQPQLPGRPQGQAHPRLLGPVLRPGLRHLRPGSLDAHHRCRPRQVLHRPGRIHRPHSVLHRRGLRVLLEQACGQDRQARLAQLASAWCSPAWACWPPATCCRSTPSWP